jgi:hypothetical protein
MTITAEHAARDTPAAVAPGHRVPGCDGYSHSDNLCETEFGDLKCGNSALVITVNAQVNEPLELAVWQEMGEELLRTSDQAAARAFAAKVRAFADAIDTGANLLT